MFRFQLSLLAYRNSNLRPILGFLVIVVIFLLLEGTTIKSKLWIPYFKGLVIRALFHSCVMNKYSLKDLMVYFELDILLQMMRDLW